MSGYPDSLVYYMWGWQVYFRISCQTSADYLFNHLDSGLDPEIMLIGFQIKNDPTTEKICFEPEEVPMNVSEFTFLDDKASPIYENHPQKDMYYSGEGMQEEMDRRRKNDSFRLALQKTMDESPENKERIHFASASVPVENHRVFIILSLNKTVYNGHLALQPANPDERIKTHRSIIEAAVEVFLDDRAKSLQLPEPGKNLSMGSRETEELLRQAARILGYTIAWSGKTPEGIHLLFNSCEKISISKYEKSESSGRLIVAKQNHPGISMTLEIQNPFSINDTRKTRKMLELSNEEIGVICNSRDILGLGKVNENYSILSESIFQITFKGTHCWEVAHNSRVLMEMRYGVPYLPSEIIDSTKFLADAKRVFPDITQSQFENLFSLATQLTHQKKGAMLVIAKDAAAEAARLSKQCINIKPIRLNKDLLMSLTSIDGAVIIDIDGVAYAKAAILDGLVGLNGDSARGSRYNSALTYQEYRGLNNPTMVVVVSEDGMVDIIPNLRPQVKHAEILKVIDVLKQLNTLETFDAPAFYEAMTWLQNRKFYLTEIECQIINNLKASLEEIDRKSDEKVTWRVFEDLTTDAQMNDTYYSDNP